MPVLQHAQAGDDVSAHDWRESIVAEDGTHHLLGARPMYARRFTEVLKFHAPGLAPVRDDSGAYHIDADAHPAYAARFGRTFGFYEGRAAVVTEGGWAHVGTDGVPISESRWDWAGNFQGGRCPVRDTEGRYCHIDPAGSPVYAAEYRYAGDYRDGIAVVQREDGDSSHIDERGGIVHGRWFLDLDVFHKGFARARDGLGWTHVDRNGDAAYARRFAMVEPFYNGQARVERFDGALEIIDERGTTVATLRSAPHAAPLGDRVLTRSAWGRVHLVEPEPGRREVVKWTRGSNDREVEALIGLRGVQGVPALLGRNRFDMNDQVTLEYCAGDVVGQPRKLRAYSERDAVRVAIDLLGVCEAMHARGWVHTDIHPGNVLAGSPATLLDYACAVRASYDAPWRGEINWGVWEYVAPEQLADYGELDPAVDVYATACLCLAMIRGAPPVRIAVDRHLKQGGWPAVRHAFRRASLRPALAALSAPLREVLVPALSDDRQHRPTARALRDALFHV